MAELPDIEGLDQDELAGLAEAVLSRLPDELVVAVIRELSVTTQETIFDALNEDQEDED